MKLFRSGVDRVATAIQGFETIITELLDASELCSERAASCLVEISALEAERLQNQHAAVRALKVVDRLRTLIGE